MSHAIELLAPAGNAAALRAAVRGGADAAVFGASTRSTPAAEPTTSRLRHWPMPAPTRICVGFACT